MFRNYFSCIHSILLLSLLVFAGRARASHVWGADLAYSHVSGSTYRVSLSVYADCSAGALFTSLPSSIGQICVFDGATFVDSLVLYIDTPSAGVEITPMCIGSATSCNDPSTSAGIGVKKFVYSGVYTLPHTSMLWRFIFNGKMLPNSLARYTGITNIAGIGTTLQLEDTLNNSGYYNSSPALTSTQSWHIVGFIPQSYNPMAVDPDGDVLSYVLSSAIEGSMNCSVAGSPVAYTGTAWPGTPISAEAPIAVTAGSMNFNTPTGQLSFTPNAYQRATVVYNIRETRGGVLVGTSQRELTFEIRAASGGHCTGMPYAGTAIILPGCGTSDSVGLPASICGSVTLQWQSSPDGTSWTDIPGATNVKYPIPATPMHYRCAVTCTFSGLTAFTSDLYYSTLASSVMSAGVNYPPDTNCTAINFTITDCSATSTHTVTTYFGDGTSATSGFIGTTTAMSHNYIFPGTYTVRHILYDGTLAIDSLRYTHNYHYCHTLPVKLYYDADLNCQYGASDLPNPGPVTVEIDSNGVPIDTISATSGFYYKALGGPGTVYAFKVLSMVSGLYVSCPLSATLYDTIATTPGTYAPRYFGMQCTGGSGYDLGLLASLTAGRHAAVAHIIVANATCMPVNDTVTMSFSPKYRFHSSHPTPVSIAGNTVKWTPGIASASFSPQNINVTVEIPPGAPYLTAGDTVRSNYNVRPMVADAMIINNDDEEIDTVKTSFDPNTISVSPSGYIPAGTELTYTIDFENVGNAPAENIHVMDTLSDLLIPGTLSVVGASHAMDIATIPYGTNTIVKFDFPGINLPDTSHDNECHGMLVYKIRARSGLAPGTLIPNRAGIYFDDNEVVMTNTATDIIQFPSTTVKAVDRNNTIIFPNPANNAITIRAEAGVYDHVVITNTVGRSLITKTFDNADDTVDVSMLVPGMYYVTLSGKNGTTTGKFVKL